LNLSADWRDPWIAHHRQFLWRGPRLDSAAPAVVANPVAPVVRDLIVVNIMSDVDVDVRYRPVVVEPALIPIGAVIAAAGISIPVIDAAIVADVRTPIARVPMVVPTIETPPRRRPERIYIRGQNPRSGNPIVTSVRIAPGTGRPYVIVARSGRLAVIGERRRGFRSLDGLFVGIVLIVILRIRRIDRRGRIVLRRLRRDRRRSCRRRSHRGRLLIVRLVRWSQVAIGWIAARNIGRLILNGLVLRSLLLRFIASCQTYQ
jgi:hypothetical protein